MALTPERGILIVGTFPAGGSPNHGSHPVCADLASRLAAAGWRVITTSSKSGRAARLADMLGTIVARRREYAAAQVDVFSGLAFVWAEACCLALRRLRKPYALTLHGGNLPAFARRHPARVRRLLRSARVVTTPSRYLLEHMRAYREAILPIPNPLSLPRYPFRLRAPARPALVWLRAFHRAVYHPGLAVRVAAMLLDDFPELQLVMVGPDKDGSRGRVESLAAGLGLNGRLTLPGGVPRAAVPGWLARGDVFLNTARVDNTPVSVLEAMACGLCVVSTDVGGIPYLLEHESDALLVPPDDAAAMAGAVRRVLADPQLAARLSRNARRKAEGFDWDALLPRWERLFQEMIAHG